MCGIAGFFNPAWPADESAALLRRMACAIAHRGPDGKGWVADRAAGLASARLAIIDRQGGDQPMSDEEQRYWIVYNGEIYNYPELRSELAALGHRFRTHSDTEVVLEAWKAWGPEAVPRLNGGFAFAVYDRRRRELALSRDRWGKRPLFVTRLGPTFLFGSELKTFLQVPGVEFRWDVNRLRMLFSAWTVLPDETPFAGMQQLLPGACLLVGLDGERLVRPQMRLGADPAGDVGGDPVAGVREVLRESVRVRLRSDVPVGTYLSGGLDSAIVTQLAVELSAYQVRTFSVAFEDRAFDESAEQETVSRHLGTRHTTLRVSSAEIGRAFPEALWFGELPVFRTAFVPMYLLSRRVRDEGLKVVLTGEGADETFLGYDIFKETRVRASWSALSPEERREAIAGLYAYEPHFAAANVRALTAVFAEHSSNPEAPLFSHQMRFAAAGLASRLVGGSAGALTRLSDWIGRFDARFASRDSVGRAQMLEFATLLAGYLLSTQGDRMAFAHGVENRSPFLDPAVVGFANALPRDLRLRGGVEEKWILRQGFSAALPALVVRRRKQPYRAPDAAVFLGAERPDYVDDLLSPAALRRIEGLDSTFADRFVAKMRSIPLDRVAPGDSQALTLLLSLALLDRYFVRRESPAQAISEDWTVARLLRDDEQRSAGGE